MAKIRKKKKSYYSRKVNMWRIGFATDWRGDNQDVLCFVFYGAFKNLLSIVFDQMCMLFDGYEVYEDNVVSTFNRHSYRMLTVRITGPHFDLMAADEWPMMIIHYMKKAVQCEVKYYKDYEKLMCQ